MSTADEDELVIAAVQAEPRLVGEPIEGFHTDVLATIREHPDCDLVAFPELHLFGDDVSDSERSALLNASAEPLDGPRVEALKQIAGDLGVWLIPGTLCERGPSGELFNTAVVLSPKGELHTWYRKVFPWRPYEPYDPGDRFVTFDLPGHGRIGLSICYDAWFPEVARHLAWMGAEVVVNLVKTTTRDREQELVLARATAIMNQTYVVSLNCAGPVGRGRSTVVGPHGDILHEIRTADHLVIRAELDLAVVDDTRLRGTAGLNRVWSQMSPSDPVIDLPLYDGSISPERWSVPTRSER